MHEKHRTTLTIAIKHYGPSSGQTGIVSAGLDGTGRRLLKAHGKLAVRGSVTITVRGGHTTTAARFRLTLEQRQKRRK